MFKGPLNTNECDSNQNKCKLQGSDRGIASKAEKVLETIEKN